MNAHVSKVEFPRAAGLTVEYIRSWKLSHHKVKIRSIVTTPQRQLEGGGEGRRREGEGGREGEGERREGGRREVGVYLLLVQDVHRGPCTATVIARKSDHFQNTVSVCTKKQQVTLIGFLSPPPNMY